MSPRSRSSWLARVGVAVAVAGWLLAVSPSHADDYESDRAGHPLRLAAYVLHPVGVLLETLIARPAHWLVSRGPMRTLFGHEESFREFDSQAAASAPEPAPAPGGSPGD